MSIECITADSGFAAFEGNNAGHPLLINFVASWCLPCRALKPVIDDLASHYLGVLVSCRVDIEDCPEAARRFGVKAVPMTIVLKDGDQLLKVVGPLSKTRFAIAIEEALSGRSSDGGEKQ